MSEIYSFTIVKHTEI